MSDGLVLALNPGSSSYKAAVRGPDAPLRMVAVDGALTVGDRRMAVPQGIPAAVDAIARELEARRLTPAAVAHRVVHGGPDHHVPTVVDRRLLADLRTLVPLAPLHLPGDIASIEAARVRWPDVPHVACFDTGFHHALPLVDRRLPLPDELDALGLRRYGFHGLSMESVLHARPDLGQVVVAHLGGGCSVTAIADGRPRHTTMSLTPTGGMMSVTRSGDLDPEVVLALIDQHGYAPSQVRGLLGGAAGIDGVSGGRSDVSALLAATDDRAVLAVDMFVRSAAMAIAASATALERWETLVFTGGIGERSAPVRERICARLASSRSPTSPTGLASTGVRVLVVPADEEGVLDRATRQLLGITPPAQSVGTG